MSKLLSSLSGSVTSLAARRLQMFSPNTGVSRQHWTTFKTSVSESCPAMTLDFGSAHMGLVTFSRLSSEQCPTVAAYIYCSIQV